MLGTARRSTVRNVGGSSKPVKADPGDEGFCPRKRKNNLCYRSFITRYISFWSCWNVWSWCSIHQLSVPLLTEKLHFSPFHRYLGLNVNGVHHYLQLRFLMLDLNSAGLWLRRGFLTNMQMVWVWFQKQIQNITKKISPQKPFNIFLIFLYFQTENLFSCPKAASSTGTFPFLTECRETFAAFNVILPTFFSLSLIHKGALV